MSDFDPTDFEGEEQRQAAKQKAEAQELAWEIDDLQWLMGSKRGRRIVWRLLQNAGVNRLSYTPGDALATAFNEGQRNQGNRLQALIQAHASEAYGLMVQERSNVRR